MSNPSSPSDQIHVRGLRLWSHVGVLEHERIQGQWFELDFSLGLNLEESAIKDELSLTSDYSIGINELQKLSFQINCLTIEAYSQKILDLLENIYGKVPIKIYLRKCSPPIAGFTGFIEIERSRNIIVS